MLCPRTSIRPGEESVVHFYIDEVQQADGSVELITVIAQSTSAPLLFLQTSYHVEVSPEDPPLIVDVIGNPFQMMKEGFLVSWGCGTVDIRDKA